MEKESNKSKLCKGCKKFGSREGCYTCSKPPADKAEAEKEKCSCGSSYHIYNHPFKLDNDSQKFESANTTVPDPRMAIEVKEEELGCVHGRPAGQICPHCSGINDIPMGVSQWLNHGKKYRYDKFFTGKLIEQIKSKKKPYTKENFEYYNQAIDDIIKLIENLK